MYKKKVPGIAKEDSELVPCLTEYLKLQSLELMPFLHYDKGAWSLKHVRGGPLEVFYWCFTGGVCPWRYALIKFIYFKWNFILLIH